MNWSTLATRLSVSVNSRIRVSSRVRPSVRVPVVWVRTATWPWPSGRKVCGTGLSVPSRGTGPAIRRRAADPVADQVGGHDGFKDLRQALV
jgi:hypothetical protein